MELRWVLLDAANYKYAHQDKWRWRGIEHPLRMVRLRGKRVWCDYDRAEVQQQELEPDSSGDDRLNRATDSHALYTALPNSIGLQYVAVQATRRPWLRLG